MESNAAPSSLLSLTGQVEDIILSHLSSAEGGPQAILNLRLVCSTTKMWVDTLRPTEAKRIFSNQHVKVELSEKRLEEFLESPPPPIGVTSLYFTHTDFLNDNIFPREKDDSWTRFLEAVSLWKPKVESLELDVLLFPNQSKFADLMSFLHIRSLSCHSIKQIKSFDRLPKYWFELEELSVKHFHISDFEKHDFFNKFANQSNLKKLKMLEVSCADALDLTHISKLIESKEEDDNFQLSLHFDSFSQISAKSSSSSDQMLDHEDEIFRLAMDEFLTAFALAVVDSSSLIQIRGIHDEQLSIIQRRLQLNLLTGHKFTNRILGISVFVPYDGFKLQDFRNLESVDSLDDDPENLENATSDYFPPHLKRLGVSSGFPTPASLPNGLTFLDIQHCETSTDNFLRSIGILPFYCRRLESLKIFWRPKLFLETLPDDFQSDNKFEKLKKLDFMATVPDETYIPLCRMILLRCLQVHQLSLTELNLRFFSTSQEPLRVMDSSILEALLNGPISTSVKKIEIEKCFVTGEAFSLLATLMSTAPESQTK